jgi:hypothetical protein
MCDAERSAGAHKQGNGQMRQGPDKTMRGWRVPFAGRHNGLQVDASFVPSDAFPKAKLVREQE